jgi:hypothetical protein
MLAIALTTAIVRPTLLVFAAVHAAHAAHAHAARFLAIFAAGRLTKVALAHAAFPPTTGFLRHSTALLGAAAALAFVLFAARRPPLLIFVIFATVAATAA